MHVTFFHPSLIILWLLFSGINSNNSPFNVIIYNLLFKEIKLVAFSQPLEILLHWQLLPNPIHKHYKLPSPCLPYVFPHIIYNLSLILATHVAFFHPSDILLSFLGLYNWGSTLYNPPPLLPQIIYKKLASAVINVAWDQP